MKKKKGDYLQGDLPRNRFFQFFDILKNEWLSLVVYGLLFLLSALPFIIYRYVHLKNVSAIASSGAEDAYATIVSSYLLYLLICLPLFLLMGVALSGILRVYKRIGWGKGYFRAADCLEGIKENAVSTLCMTFCFWLAYALLTYAGVYGAEVSSWVYWFSIAIKGLIVFPFFLFALYVFAVYRDSVSSRLMAAVVVFLKRSPSIILGSFLLEAPLLLLFLSSSYIQLLVPIAYALIYFPLGYLALILLYNRALDREINKTSFPELVDLGLSRHKQDGR